MVTIKKTLKIDNSYKNCEIELKQDGKCLLVVDQKVIAKYSSFENCLFNNSFVEFIDFSKFLEKDKEKDS